MDTDVIRGAREDLGALIRALHPLHDHLVLCGGWAALLYRGLDWTGAPQTDALLTTDIDWAVRAEIPGSPAILELLANAGFQPLQLRTDSHPPVTYYQHQRWGTDRPGQVYAEFLSPMSGARRPSETKARITVEPQQGLSAQLLRFMDLALHEPLTIDATQIAGETGGDGLRVRVPHPANYIIHKALVAPRRGSRSQWAKDLAYIFDVSVICRPAWAALATRVGEIRAANPAWRKWVEKAERDLAEWFEASDAPGALAVHAVLEDYQPDRAPTSHQVSEMMRVALKAIGLAK